MDSLAMWNLGRQRVCKASEAASLFRRSDSEPRKKPAELLEADIFLLVFVP